MREILLTTLAAAAILSGLIFNDRAEAMLLAAPLQPAVAAIVGAHVERAAVICGANGCSPVQTSPLRRHRLPPHLGSVPAAPNAEPYSLTAQLRHLRSGHAVPPNTLP